MGSSEPPAAPPETVSLAAGFGSADERRPVAATAWLKLLWMRPVTGWMSEGRAST